MIQIKGMTTSEPESASICGLEKAKPIRSITMQQQPAISDKSAVSRSIPSLAMTALLATLFLHLDTQPSSAGSATWNLNPTSGDWNTAANWTPQTVPNGLTDMATFSTSNMTRVSLSSDVTLDGLVFDSAASAFTIDVGSAFLSFFSGAGITNNSGVVQNIVIPLGAVFINSGTAGNQISFTIGGGVFDSAAVLFEDATAGSCTCLAKGPLPSQTQGGIVDFEANSNADHGTFIIEGTSVSGTAGAFTIIAGNASAGHGIFTITGDKVSGGFGAFCTLTHSANAADATFINLGGSVAGALGATMYFQDSSRGGRARIKLFGNSSLDISDHLSPGITTGSIEGNGNVFLGGIGSIEGATNLTVGSNNLNTTFSGVLRDGGQGGGIGGALTKIGRGQLTLSGPNSYTGGTTVMSGTLLAANVSGSATGTGPVQVAGGTLGGIGVIAGAITIASGPSVAFLAPGKATVPGALTIQSALTLNSLATYKVDLNSTTASTDQVVTNGVTINSGALISVADLGAGPLTRGTTFTIMNNTAATPIGGTFTNLADGSTLTVGSNTYLVSYEGGDGNDLTLTVQ
jgi:autotransporter-associated beta strand protein